MTDQTQHIQQQPFPKSRAGATTAPFLLPSSSSFFSLGFVPPIPIQSRLLLILVSHGGTNSLSSSFFFLFASRYFLRSMSLSFNSLSLIKIVLRILLRLLFSVFSDSVFLGCCSADKVDADGYILLQRSFSFFFNLVFVE